MSLRRFFVALICLHVVASLVGSRLAAAPEGTRLLRTPTVSATQIAFAYANNIWSVERAGGIARRLTSFQGQTTNPHFSPDGKWIAFSGEYAGNTDVYVVPAEGGEPTRLTWHPGGDDVQGWTPDGKSIVFASSRATWAPSGAPRFWTVPVEGGVEEPMALPRALSGQDFARRLAHRVSHEQLVGRGAPQLSRRPEPARSGSSISRPTISSRRRGPTSKDIDPVWVGDVVYFLSDRDGVANVWSFDTKSKKLTQAHEVQRLRRQDDRLGRRRGRVRAGRLHSRARSEERDASTSCNITASRRFSVDDAALGGRDRAG